MKPNEVMMRGPELEFPLGCWTTRPLSSGCLDKAGQSHFSRCASRNIKIKRGWIIMIIINTVASHPWKKPPVRMNLSAVWYENTHTYRYIYILFLATHTTANVASSIMHLKFQSIPSDSNSATLAVAVSPSKSLDKRLLWFNMTTIGGCFTSVKPGDTFKSLTLVLFSLYEGLVPLKIGTTKASAFGEYEL